MKTEEIKKISSILSDHILYNLITIADVNKKKIFTRRELSWENRINFLECLRGIISEEYPYCYECKDFSDEQSEIEHYTLCILDNEITIDRSDIVQTIEEEIEERYEIEEIIESIFDELGDKGTFPIR